MNNLEYLVSEWHQAYMVTDFKNFPAVAMSNMKGLRKKVSPEW